MPYVDSIDKIVMSYFRVVTTETLRYKKFVFEPKPLRVSEGIFRGYTCPEGCGGCCPRFSLDYLPTEDFPPGVELTPRDISINGRMVRVWSDLQVDHTSHHCRNLNHENGRCRIHGRQPFSCDFELIRTSISEDDGKPNGLNTRLFGRGWAMLRVDGGRGAKCTITPPDRASVADCVRKLQRLKQWADHFQIRTCLDRIIEWAASGPHDTPGYFNQEFKPHGQTTRRLSLFEGPRGQR